MSFTIRDGKGTGKEVKVTPDNRLSTAAITETEAALATSLGTRFNINTGTVTLTNASNTSLLYVKNNENNDMIVTAIIYLLGTSTGGSGDATVDIIRNPLAGDIVTNANDVDILQNFNFGSTRTLAADTFKGATGETLLSGGNVIVSSLLSTPAGRIFIGLDEIVIPKGSTIGINYTPPTGNTSQGIQVALVSYVKTFEV
jgi:hypothetical protein